MKSRSNVRSSRSNGRSSSSNIRSSSTKEGTSMSGDQTRTNSSNSRSKDKSAIYVASDSMISSSGNEIEKQTNSRKPSTNWANDMEHNMEYMIDYPSMSITSFPSAENLPSYTPSRSSSPSRCPTGRHSSNLASYQPSESQKVKPIKEPTKPANNVKSRYIKIIKEPNTVQSAHR